MGNPEKMPSAICDYSKVGDYSLWPFWTSWMTDHPVTQSLSHCYCILKMIKKGHGESVKCWSSWTMFLLWDIFIFRTVIQEVFIHTMYIHWFKVIQGSNLVYIAHSKSRDVTKCLTEAKFTNVCRHKTIKWENRHVDIKCIKSFTNASLNKCGTNCFLKVFTLFSVHRSTVSVSF